MDPKLKLVENEIEKIEQKTKERFENQKKSDKFIAKFIFKHWEILSEIHDSENMVSCVDTMLNELYYYMLSEDVISENFSYTFSSHPNSFLGEKLGFITKKDGSLTLTKEGMRISEEFERISNPDFSLDLFCVETVSRFVKV